MNVYRVVLTIWHAKDNKFYEPGEVVDLSHLDGIALRTLLNSGAVVIGKAMPEEKKKTKLSAPVQEGEKWPEES